MFSFKVQGPVLHLKEKLRLEERLKARTPVSPKEFTDILTAREQNYTNFNYSPSSSLDTIQPGAYYLTGVDNLERRSYQRKPLQSRSYSTLRESRIRTNPSFQPKISNSLSFLRLVGK